MVKEVVGDVVAGGPRNDKAGGGIADFGILRGVGEQDGRATCSQFWFLCLLSSPTKSRVYHTNNEHGHSKGGWDRCGKDRLGAEPLFMVYGACFV